MIDVSRKAKVLREATAEGMIYLKPETVKRVQEGKTVKGDPLYTAKIAAILAAKKTSELIPLCHPLPLTNVEVCSEVLEDTSAIKVFVTVKTCAQTGVEMEALTAVSAALLTIWDMTKQYEKNSEGQYPTTAIQNIHVIRKYKQKANNSYE
ncbi:MAG: cyclic pyranopterin monophosphate synthase MoaC [Nitrososphaerota archaeon]|jgi:cyclic pyranopterin phosphate synthase|uniref:cyclic pyranopterin monophosphate synthase MoaC n=1 Tax=Candidatus Bathycorpusculum sp. TaxID=2994959 RepID=UPI00282F7780|nr:cyclic pyranopterin monophosphate synthase MoaC [Candidatus Termiticorpusculum sp.]MCL2257678.1 cyclic pyranopterin monophosphate synthase MoaC [Candidatus Termiticorpusculum sp.]MCL2291900.1 cyclic pyranopterin monophosphate synthase MoaC [Candidatus Termiticorpusculum sp.]MDR0461115.1 cyclic pyranopterin monophosphate synthase MoaC [Nitrososphaerota archaeon]